MKRISPGGVILLLRTRPWQPASAIAATAVVLAAAVQRTATSLHVDDMDAVTTAVAVLVPALLASSAGLVLDDRLGEVEWLAHRRVTVLQLLVVIAVGIIGSTLACIVAVDLAFVVLARNMFALSGLMLILARVSPRRYAWIWPTLVAVTLLTIERATRTPIPILGLLLEPSESIRAAALAVFTFDAGVVLLWTARPAELGTVM